jgi:glycosyltransferase involved in cell wall biosynthesis
MALTISVVIPTYNRAALTPRAVASALANVEAGDEIIVVDDGSTDNTEQALTPFRERIRLLQGRHAGAGAARNLGIPAARGDVVAFLDSDDEWMPNKLVLQRALFAACPDVLFCFTDFCLRLGDKEEHHYLEEWHHDTRSWDEILAPGTQFSALASLPPDTADFRVHVGDIYRGEMLRDYIATFTMAARRVAAGAALRFAEDVPTYEDWECFARLAGAGQAAYLDCETAWNHGHAGPRLTDADAFAAASARLTILERVWGRDEKFLANDGADYRRRRREFHQLRARWLLCRGRTREAREDLQQAGAGPLTDRVLAALPGPVVRGLFGLRRLVRGQAPALKS